MIATHRWQKFSAPSNSDFPSSRNFHSSCVYKNSMYLFGGKSNGYHSDMYKFNLQTKKWKLVNQHGKAPAARYGHGISVYQVPTLFSISNLKGLYLCIWWL